MASAMQKAMCTANRGFHQTAKAALDCPYHRAIALASNPSLNVAAAKKSSSRAEISSHAPQGVPVRVETKDKDGGTKETWLLDDVTHRDGEPAVVHILWNGSRLERWFRHGAPYRADGLPTGVRYDASGEVNKEQWHSPIAGGTLHRDGDLPASINYYGDGKSTCEWYIHGKHCRTDTSLPVSVDTDGNGMDWRNSEGIPHREDGPAQIYVIRNGYVSAEYLLKGEKVTQDEVYAVFLSRLGVSPENDAARAYLFVPPEGPEQRFARPSSDEIALALELYPNPPGWTTEGNS